jgi:hypothetical protein
MNPVIFYRYMEQQNGSADNSFIGMDFKWNFLKHFQLYGQAVFDELLIDSLKARNGSWVNKQAWQLGMKYINVGGIKNLDLQLETNNVRPYTYSHKSLYTSYSHYDQPIAHPIGANFKEYIAIVRYQPLKKLTLTAKAIYYKYGADTSYALDQIGPGQNNGGNILKSYDAISAARPTGLSIGDGVQTKVIYLSFTASFMIRHNMFIDLKQVIRKSDSAIDSQDLKTNFTSISLRWNIAQRLQEF